MFRSFLGDKLRIVVLKPTQTILKERLAKRHGSDEETLNYLMVKVNYLWSIKTILLFLEICPEDGSH